VHEYALHADVPEDIPLWTLDVSCVVRVARLGAAGKVHAAAGGALAATARVADVATAIVAIRRASHGTAAFG
jgi:hypothetical protein